MSAARPRAGADRAEAGVAGVRALGELVIPHPAQPPTASHDRHVFTGI